MYSSDCEALGSVRGDDRVDTKIYTIQVHIDTVLCQTFSVSKALPTRDERLKVLVKLSKLDIHDDDSIMDSLKITKTLGGERIPVPDQVKNPTVDIFQRMAALSWMLSETIQSDISLWFKKARGQVTPQVDPQSIETPPEKDQEFIRLLVDRIAHFYFDLDTTVHVEGLAILIQCCMTIIIHDDGKGYLKIEEYVPILMSVCIFQSTAAW